MQTQSLAFGEIPTFSWLEPFRVQCTQGNPAGSSGAPTPAGPSDSQNPFADDTFDPLKHMNLQSTDTKVMASGVSVGMELT